MKASPKDQAALVELQEVDLNLSRIQHGLDNHPLKGKVAEVEGRIADLKRSILAQTVQISDGSLKVEDLEKQVEQVKNRASLQQERLDGGKIPLRDMSAVEHEIARIKERQGELEEELLAQLEFAEEQEEILGKLKSSQSAQEQDLQASQEELEKQLEKPQNQLRELQQKREELRGQIAPEVVEEYDHVRSRVGPLAVLKLQGSTLVDAPVSLTSGEIGNIQRSPEDELWYSDETGYLVVRV